MKRVLRIMLLFLAAFFVATPADAATVLYKNGTMFGTPQLQDSSYGKIIKINLGGNVKFVRHSKFLTEAQNKQAAYTQLRADAGVSRFTAFAYRCPGYYTTRVYADRYGTKLIGTLKVYVPTSDIPANQSTCNNDVITPPAGPTPVAPSRPTINVSHPNPTAKEVGNMAKKETVVVNNARVTDIDDPYGIPERYIPEPEPEPPPPPILYEIPDDWEKPNEPLFRDVESATTFACSEVGVGSNYGDTALLYHAFSDDGAPYQCVSIDEINACYVVRVLHLNRQGWNIEEDANIYLYTHEVLNLETANLDADLRAMLGNFDLTVCRDQKVMPDEMFGDGTEPNYEITDLEGTVLARSAYSNFTCTGEEAVSDCAILEPDPYFLTTDNNDDEPPDSGGSPPIDGGSPRRSSGNAGLLL